MYTRRLEDVMEVPVILDGYRSCWAQYTLKAKNSGQRERILQALDREGIPTAIFYPTPIHRSPAFANRCVCPGSLAVTEDLAQRVFSIPMHPYLTEAEIDRICGIIRAVS